MGLVYDTSTSASRSTAGFETFKGSTGGTAAITRLDGSFNLQYPINLDVGTTSDSEFGLHRVVFFINVSANSSKTNTNDTGSNVKDPRAESYDLPPNQYAKRSGVQLVQAEMSTLPGGGGGSVMANTFKMKRLAAAICLYVPNNLSISYAVQWAEEEMSLVSAVVDTALQMAANSIGGGSQAASKGASATNDPGKSILGSVGALAARAVLNKSSYLQKISRTTSANTRAEQLFRGVDFRTFSYDYDFAPRTEKEAAGVLDIIRMFRFHMLPEFADASQFLYVYPSEFEIRYYVGDKENEYLEKQMTAVLTNCTINYTPNGQFTTFANGMPTHIRMQLQFKELGTPSKETSPYDKSGL